jgi:hypothetical protein
MKILLDFSAKYSEKIYILKLEIGDEKLPEIGVVNGIGAVNFATSMNLVIFKSTVFPHHSLHKYAWTSLDRKQIDYVLISKRQRWGVVYMPSFRGADCY